MFDIEKDLGFIILFPEIRLNSLRITASTIKSSFKNATPICVVPNEILDKELEISSSVCKTIRGGNSISSMVNTGVKNATHLWNIILIAGNVIRYNPIAKYARFLKSEKEILYRVSNKNYWKWKDSSIHGLLMHKDTIKKVGNFPEEEDFKQCKVLWEQKALTKGFVFKGLVGVRMN